MKFKFCVAAVGGLMMLASNAMAEGPQIPKSSFSGKVYSKEFELVRSYFDTDNMPLDAEVLKSEDSDLTIREEIRLRGFDREWVSATLARPKGIDNPPVVILLHGLTQSKAQWWRQEGEYSFPSKHREVLVNNGIAVLALDARNHGPRMEPKDFKSPYEYVRLQYFAAARKMAAETALDVRRVIDYLETRKDVDASKVGIAGFSLGAYIGWMATAVDERIKRSLLIALPILPPPAGGYQNFADPYHFMEGYQQRNLMLIGATQDIFYTPEQMNTLFAKIPTKSKEMVWFESTHDLPYSSAKLSERFFVGRF